MTLKEGVVTKAQLAGPSSQDLEAARSLAYRFTVDVNDPDGNQPETSITSHGASFVAEHDGVILEVSVKTLRRK